MEKKVTNNQGTFVYSRGEVAKEFTCGRCTQVKKSKASAQWTDKSGVTKTICNGCYGNLLSKG